MRIFEKTLDKTEEKRDQLEPQDKTNSLKLAVYQLMIDFLQKEIDDYQTLLDNGN